jgi:hypothetical protein
MADRVVAATNTLNYFRHEFNATARDVGSIQSVLDASGFIASATDISEAIPLINTPLTAITTDANVFTGDIIFEGATDDAYETTLTVTDPTADRTITLPNLTGTVGTVTGTETWSNKTLTSPTIDGGTFSGTFTGTMDITGTVLSGASPLVFEGATADDYETTLAVTDPTADRTVTMPNATDTIIGRATTDTLTNKTVDLASNTFTGSIAEWNSALQSDSFGTLTGSETWTQKTFTSPAITTPTFDDSVSGTAFKDQNDMSSDSATAAASQQSIKKYVDDQVTAEDLDIAPDSGTPQSIDLDSATLTLAGGTGIATTASSTTLTMDIDSTVMTLTGSQILTYKTFTSPIIDSMTFASGTSTSGLSIGATGIIFEGATDDAYETTITVVDPTADRTLTIPNETATLATTGSYTTKASHISKCIALG